MMCVLCGSEEAGGTSGRDQPSCRGAQGQGPTAEEKVCATSKCESPDMFPLDRNLCGAIVMSHKAGVHSDGSMID